MCDGCEAGARDATSPAISRRTLVRAGIGAGLSALILGRGGHQAAAANALSAVGAVGALSAGAMPAIVARSAWGGDLPVKGRLVAEQPRFLLVHHTQSPGSDYQRAAVPRLLRGIYGYHTSRAKGWPDVAYNFFVDRYGVIYEGRTGSIAGPVRGSATGGNQGYSQLCCFLGDTSSVPPTGAAQSAMVDLLAWLATRYRIDPTPGATATFTSLGSNRFTSGVEVTTRTIAGHRDMTFTECPGDACYALLESDIPSRVLARARRR